MRTVRGYQASPTGGKSRTDFKVYGMKDGSDAQRAYDSIAGLEGIHEISVNIPQRRVSVSHAAQPGIGDRIRKTLLGVGFRTQLKS